MFDVARIKIVIGAANFPMHKGKNIEKKSAHSDQGAPRFATLIAANICKRRRVRASVSGATRVRTSQEPTHSHHRPS